MVEAGDLCRVIIESLYTRMALVAENPHSYPDLISAGEGFVSREDKKQISGLYEARFHGVFGGISGNDWIFPKVIRPFRIETSEIRDSMFNLRVRRMSDGKFYFEIKPRVKGFVEDRTQLGDLVYSTVYESVDKTQKRHPSFNPRFKFDEQALRLNVDVSNSDPKASADFLSYAVDQMYAHRREPVSILDLLIMAPNEHGPRETEEDDQARPGEANE